MEQRGGDLAQLVERRTDTPLGQVRLPGAASDFIPESTFSADSLTVSILEASVQLHALTSVRTLKISSTGRHAFVWTHENTTCTVRNGQRWSCDCCSLTQVVRRHEYPARDKWSAEKKGVDYFFSFFFFSNLVIDMAIVSAEQAKIGVTATGGSNSTEFPIFISVF